MYHYTYIHALIGSLFFYLLQHIIFFIRFGRINTNVNISDMFMIIAGFLIFGITFIFMNRLVSKKQQNWLWVIFALTLPVSIIGAVMGGLLGPIGAIAYSIIPLLITLSICSYIIKKNLK